MYNQTRPQTSSLQETERVVAEVALKKRVIVMFFMSHAEGFFLTYPHGLYLWIKFLVQKSRDRLVGTKPVTKIGH